MSTQPLDKYENALVQYLKRNSDHYLDDLIVLYGWRVEMHPNTILANLPSVVEWVWKLCERCELLGHSFSSLPGGFGGFGVLCDATPSREWALLLKTGRSSLDDPNRLYWYRILSVLCSRLYMAEVVKLPGYNHDAMVGPFGVAEPRKP